MNFAGWRAHFEANAARPIPFITPPVLDGARKTALAESLSRFQLGEAGEGRIAKQIDGVTLPGVDADYRASLKLFVKEEGRHARILALMVNALGGRLLTHQWTDKLFTQARRLVGIRFKLLVLLAAEVIGIGFYGLLSGLLPESPMKWALGQICRDEEAHLVFHADFFRAQAKHPLAWRLLRLAWWPVGVAAVVTVLLDHRRTLRVFGVSFGAAFEVLFARVCEASARMAAPLDVQPRPVTQLIA